MFRYLFERGIALCLCWMVVGCQETSSPIVRSPATTPAPASASPTLTRAIVLGDISDEPTETIAAAQPFIDYVADRLSAQGIKRGEVKIAPDMATMAQWLKEGKVDIFMDSPYPAAVVGELSEAKPILRRWKDGIAEYHTLLFARKDSSITQLQDLKGKAIGFEEKFSTSGYLLPFAYLRAAGFDLIPIPDVKFPIPHDRIGYSFTGDEDSTIQWVVSGRVAAGAVSSAVFQAIPETTRAQFIVLAHTQSVPRQFVLIRPQIEPLLEAEIVKVLVRMEETPTGQSILAEFDRTAQFDPLPTDDSLDPIRKLSQQLPH
jgi:phosphonate transport system substrate-binding protein